MSVTSIIYAVVIAASVTASHTHSSIPVSHVYVNKHMSRSVTLTCEHAGHMTQNKLQWLKDGRPITDQTTPTVILPPFSATGRFSVNLHYSSVSHKWVQTLLIHGITSVDQGVYSCVSIQDNGIRTIVKKTFVSFLYEPVSLSEARVAAGTVYVVVGVLGCVGLAIAVAVLSVILCRERQKPRRDRTRRQRNRRAHQITIMTIA